MSGFTRRQVGLGLSAMMAAGAASACGRKPQSQQEGTPQWAVSGRWRNSLDKGRDAFRHPLDLMAFFDIKPRDVVIDLWPGAGYMTDILGPYLTRGKGRYIAALFPSSGPEQSATGTLSEKYRERFSGNKKLYGGIEFSAFGPESAALAEPESADIVLMLLVVHDLMAAGIAEKAFADAFAALKPGGLLGIEQHRADIGNVQDPGATNGYVQEPFVKQLAFEVGFAFDSASEINANPRDDKDHPFGVWTLPPQRLTSPRGQPPNPEFDGTLYESIGESDRMTLKFRKPQ